MTNHRTTRVSLIAGLAVVLALLMSPLAAQAEEVGYFRCKIDPWDAGVFINGKYYGTAAMFGHKSNPLKLKPGRYTVEFVDPRYETLRVEIQIDPGKTTTIRKSMKPLARQVEGPFGELRTEGWPNAAVYLNGKYYGNTKELGTPGHALLLKPGTYQLKIVGVDGKVLKEEQITINADETLIIHKGRAPVREK